MKKIALSLIAILAGLQLMAQESQRERIYMPYMETINMHDAYQNTMTRLLKNYIENQGLYEVVLPNKPDSVYVVERFTDAQKNAKAQKAAYVLMGEMNRLDQRVILSVKLYNTSDGSLAWSDMLKAETPDDFDPIFARVAETINTDRKASKELDIYTVTDYESEELEKVEANYSFGVQVGGGGTFFKDVDNNAPAGVGIVFAYDTRDFIIDVRGELYYSDVDIREVSINLLYPISPKARHTFFAEGGIGYSGIDLEQTPSEFDPYYNEYIETYESNSGAGMMLHLGGGFLVNRHSSVNLRLGLRGFVGAYKVGSTTPVGGMITVTATFGQ